MVVRGRCKVPPAVAPAHTENASRVLRQARQQLHVSFFFFCRGRGGGAGGGGVGGGGSERLHGPDPDPVVAPAGGEAGSVRVHVHGVDDARLPLLAEVAHAQRFVQDHDGVMAQSGLLLLLYTAQQQYSVVEHCTAAELGLYYALQFVRKFKTQRANDGGDNAQPICAWLAFLYS